MNVIRSAGGGGNRDNYKHLSENATVLHPTIRPTHSITELVRKTHFSKEEIRHLYRIFKQDSPSGEVTKHRFATIFGSIFPSGECFHYSLFVFQTIDRSNTGYIRFEDLLFTLSILVHGSIEDKLSWVFDLYDLNKDGKLTRSELLQLVRSVFQLIGPICKINLKSMNNMIEERTNQLFQTWDTQSRGFIDKKEFLRYCLQNDMIKGSMEALKSNMYL